MPKLGGSTLHVILPHICASSLREDRDALLKEVDALLKEKAAIEEEKQQIELEKEYNGKKFAHFTNLHQATFILTKDQLHTIGAKFDFTQFFGPSGYSEKCKVNTDIYQFGDWKKVICISDFEDNLIHHLPNAYIEGSYGYHYSDGTIGKRAKQRSEESRMKKALNKLL